jgi:hypothetical protein
MTWLTPSMLPMGAHWCWFHDGSGSWCLRLIVKPLFKCPIKRDLGKLSACALIPSQGIPKVSHPEHGPWLYKPNRTPHGFIY